MKKIKLLSMLFSISLLTLALASCTKSTDEKKDVEVSVTMSLPANATDAKLLNVNAKFVAIQSAKEYSETNYQAGTTPNTFVVKAIVKQGNYNITINGEVEYVLDGTNVKGEVKAERKDQSINSVDVVNNVDVELFFESSTSGLLLEELFFTGTQTPEGKQYRGDKYFKITNNSDKTLYADGVAILESAFLTVSKYEYTPDIMSQAMAVDVVYVIPGNGTDVAIEPGKSIILADNAQNHLEANKNSFDLSTANFEWYDEHKLDVDNPEVPNLDKYYSYSASIWGPHNRGFKSYAIAKIPVDKKTFFDNYQYTANYKMVLPTGTYDMSKKCYKIPNSWILDAVNVSIESKFEWIVTDPSLDMGWTYCGKVDSDVTRYGKSVRRKVEKVVDGRNILQDTNNSTVDFDAEVVPSLKK